jgi:hypothetical protein
VALNAQEKGLVEAFRSLIPARRRQVLLEMARADALAWSRFQAQAHGRFQALARRHGLDWDRMDDAQRQDFVEEFLEG